MEATEGHKTGTQMEETKVSIKMTEKLPVPKTEVRG